MSLIAIIDDDVDVLDVIADHFGVEVDKYNSPTSFLDNWQKYRVIVTDYSMPKINGVELARELRRMGYKGVLILSTGFFDAKELRDDLKLFDEIFIKPYAEGDFEKIKFLATLYGVFA